MSFPNSESDLLGLKRVARLLLLIWSVSVAGIIVGVDAKKCSGEHWVDIWGSMPQLVEPGNLPSVPYNGTASVFQNATLRQTVYITQTASTIRLQFSNAFGGSDLAITSATVALPATVNGSSGTGSSAIQPSTLQTITFSGQRSFIVPPGALVFSDPLSFSVRAQSVLAVTVYLATGQAGHAITGHPGSRTTSFMGPGDLTSSPDLSSSSPDVQRTDHWYFLSTIEAWLPAASSALAIIGDSITDGRGSTTNANNRWPDQLLSLLTQKSPTTISIINQAAGGNRLLADGLGPSALSRLDRDVIAHSAISYCLVFIGVNDLGTSALGPDLVKTADRVVSGYDQIVTRLHRAGIAAWGATITPMSGPGQAYSDPERERQRQRVNAWVRDSGRFDAVVDFDKAVRGGNGENQTQLDPRYDSGDYLHLNPEGYRVMAGAVDLALFERFRGKGMNKIVRKVRSTGEREQMRANEK
ncbi:SGNH hydrolase-type esterase domain-containing protein [Bombardia bombarda]|uniref:SGNH hydrolase-type esterase domain-containing protein n=1 Tax=Bombardia bombarda TaxID=252184 RepID=A0AA39WM62_9PEZI|nr:SGNH hydrolase-type esterase domain-containing protein [Bombardia bombarda]